MAIITVTLNPAIDKILEVPGFRIGDVLSVKESRSCPAGKGINVSRALSCLGEPNLAMGLVHPEDQHFFDTIRTACLSTCWLDVPYRVRENLTITDTDSETHLRSSVPASGTFPLEEIVSQLEAALSDAGCGKRRFVIFSGSLPAHAPANTLALLTRLCHEWGATVLLDASGPAFQAALPESPDLIKPNQNELEELLGHPLPDAGLEEIARAAQVTARQYALPTVVVSLGAGGALLYEEASGSAVWGALDEEGVSLLDGRHLHAVGSGDSMVAGLCCALQAGAQKEAVLAKGIAAGTANLFTGTPGQLDPLLCARLLGHIRTVRIF